MDDLVDKIVELHEQLTRQDIPHTFGGALAIFKAFFSRTRDWADLEEMAKL